MPNRFTGNLGQKEAPRSAAGRPDGPKIGAEVTEKPGFPGAKLPGKTQPRDRSLGVKKAKVNAQSQGL